MQPLILVLILLLAVGVHSGCHTTGEYWDDLPAALAAVDRACIFLTGEYRRRTSRSVCIDRGELRYEFYVGFDERWHWSLVDHFAAYRAIGQAECVDGLRKEVTGCERGGESWYEKWVYR